MKLGLVIIVSIILGVAEFFSLNVLSEKINKVVWMIINFILSFVLLFSGVYGIYALGRYWDLENQTRLILGICCAVTVLVSIVYNNRKK